MRPSHPLHLLLLLVLSLLAAARPIRLGPPTQDFRTAPPSTTAAAADDDGTALAPQPPGTLVHHESSAVGNGPEGQLAVAVLRVKRWEDESGRKIAGCKGWKKDGESFWWTIFWDVRRLWRTLWGQPACDDEGKGDGRGEPGGGVKRPEVEGRP